MFGCYIGWRVYFRCGAFVCVLSSLSKCDWILKWNRITKTVTKSRYLGRRRNVCSNEEWYICDKKWHLMPNSIGKV